MVFASGVARVPTAYLASYFLSVLGNSITAIALPLLVLQATGSAGQAGVLAAATTLPAVLAGLFMGGVIDLVNRRASSIATDLVSAGAIAALPVVDAVADLQLGWFIVFGVIGAFGDVPGLTAREALLPAIVRHSGMSAERLLGLREAQGAVALLVGPAAAGGLMAVFDARTVLLLSAAMSLAAALVTLLVPARLGAISAAGAPPGRTATLTQLREGWRILFGQDRFLLGVTLVNLALVVTLAGLQGLVLPVHFTLLGEPSLLGFVLSALALGLLVGGGIYAVAGDRGRRRAWFGIGLAGTVIGIALIALLPAVWVVFAGAFVLGASSGLVGSILGVLMLERVPEALRGRILGTQNAMLTAAPGVGILVAALITEHVDVAAAAALLAVLWTAASVLAAVAPALRDLGPATPGRAP